MTPHLAEALLHGYAEGALDADARREVEAHLAACADCRADAEALRALLARVRELPRAVEPERDLWQGIEARIRAQGAGGGEQGAGRSRWRWAPLALAATVVLALGALLWLRADGAAGWAVAAVAGRPTIDGRVADRVRALRPGARVETGADDSVVFRVGGYGTVALRPGSRARLVAAGLTEQRLALERGTIEAEILAPPRLFVVETRAAVATDLGCVYTLAVDEAGAGLLHVTSGWVELARETRLVVVPYDAYAVIRAGAGPGTPFVDGAPPALRAALDAFDFGAGGDAAVRRALALARPADAVSVMNLLPRTDGALRAAVYDGLAALVPPPPGVARDAVLALDQRALDRWWDTIRPPRLEREKKKKKILQTADGRRQ
jgi:hypothetical protein